MIDNAERCILTSILLIDGYSWDSLKERSVWEKDFDLGYIQPILEVSVYTNYSLSK